jgi:hypothetical protein
VGAVTFKAACRVKLENYQTWCEGVLGRDLLSPVVASLLGPDLLSPFLDAEKFKIDRSSRLELALEQAVADQIREVHGPGSSQGTGDGTETQGSLNLLEEEFPRNYDPEDGPALLFNCTCVQLGERAVLGGPFFEKSDDAWWPLQDPERPWTTSRLTINDRFRHFKFPRVRYSTAAFLSARFPGITPHARVSKAWLPEVDLVDGGYEDNSGAETLLGVLKDIINVSGELEQSDDLGEVPAVQVILLLPFYFDVSTESCPPQKIRSHDFGQSRKGFVA